MPGLSSNTHSAYFKQIDALRAVAVAMVIFSHWAGYHQHRWTDDSFWFNGEVGVQLFFIISGFLITGILLDERERAQSAGSQVRHILKAFYIRRFLRIFPLFYATLFLGFVLGHPDVRASVFWHITYLSNFFFAWRGEYMGDVSHFWSLAVEEQFYLFWPFIILFLPRRFVLPFIILCILLAPCFRFVIAFILQGNEVAINVLPLSSLDSLAGGSLLAVLHRRCQNRTVSTTLLRSVCGISIASAVGYVMLRTVVPVPENMAYEGLFIARTLLVPGLYIIVWFTACGIPGRVGAVLESKPVLYIGKISYGIYLFHFFVPGATAWLCYQFDYLIWEELGIYPYLLLNLAVLLSVSSLSWHFFESRINSLKRVFPYARNPNRARPKISLSLLSMRLLPRRTQ